MADWDGVEYRRVNSLQQWLADRALTGLELDGVESLLDVGCGDGRITAAIAERIPRARVVGIDPSPRMIAVAAPGASLTFELGDVCAMSFEDEFDAVVSFNALHWVSGQDGVSDQLTALTRIAAALHTDGTALLVLVCQGRRPSLERVAMQTTQKPTWKPYFSDYSAPFVHPDPDAWSEWAASAGLDVTSRGVEDLEWDFGSRDAFTQWCTVGFGAWTARLPEEKVERFVADVVRDYEQVAGSPGVLRFMQLRAELRKRAI